MPVADCYQTQPDSYVRFSWKGKPMEGEFYLHGVDTDPQTGYIRPFDKALRQQLVDNLQRSQNIDLLTFISRQDLICCDAFVTSTAIQTPWQILVDRVEFITEEALQTDKEAVSQCRAELLQRQYVFASNLKEPQDLLESIKTEYLRWVTPFCTPLRYQRTWLIKNRSRIVGGCAVVVAAVIAYLCFAG